MLTDILIFIAGFIVGALVLWTYNFVTDKLNIAKTGYSIGKALVMFILNKIGKKKTDNKTQKSAN
jgi:multisubunit Na+/H+ antiporter MnhE subunit